MNCRVYAETQKWYVEYLNLQALATSGYINFEDFDCNRKISNLRFKFQNIIIICSKYKIFSIPWITDSKFYISWTLKFQSSILIILTSKFRKPRDHTLRTIKHIFPNFSSINSRTTNCPKSWMIRSSVTYPKNLEFGD